MEAVRVERVGADIAIVRFDRPGRSNAFDVDGMVQLQRRLAELEGEADVRLIVLTGAGAAFCAGLDLRSVLDDERRLRLSVRDSYELQECFERSVRMLRRSNKVIIAAVNGAAVGAGLALCLAADIRIAARSASFHIGAVKIGLTAGECGISYHLPRLIGASRAFELMLTGRPVDAAEAERIGLVALVVDDNALLDRALATARQVLRNSPYATRHTKRLMWANLDAPSLDAALELENRAQVLALTTADFAEGARAFVEKREPRYTGH
ncbi:MAG TPA: enoyl-CoA hydratase-related protein [Burkholderiaceae bacterium]|nr:enoyl-CoA hydratase-related protein [Burkholderiaceae bacterium]